MSDFTLRWPGRRLSESAKKKAIDFRIRKKLPGLTIAKKLWVSPSTISLWLKDYKLTKKEKKAIYKCGGPKKTVKELSKFSNFVNKLDRNQKGRIAEVAVTLRLLFNGFSVYDPVMLWDTTDLVVLRNGRILRIQVKWLRWPKNGRPILKFKRTVGNAIKGIYKKYTKKEVDFVVGYDGFSDKAYVYAIEELKNKCGSISVDEDHLERWNKLK